MSPLNKTGSRSCVCFPRVSGDEPFREAMAEGQISFSPCERG